MKKELTGEQLDALKEIVTIGAGNAATALSQMIKKKVDIVVPRTNMLKIEDVPEVFGGAETPVISVYLQLLGDAYGVILFSFKKEDVGRLSQTLLGKKGKGSKNLSDMEKSSLKEMSTILSGAYLGAMSKVLKMSLLISTPALTEDMAGAIIDNILIETSKEADYAIIMDTELSIVDEKIMAYFFFIPDVPSLKKILNAMGVNGGK